MVCGGLRGGLRWFAVFFFFWWFVVVCGNSMDPDVPVKRIAILQRLVIQLNGQVYISFSQPKVLFLSPSTNADEAKRWCVIST